MINLELPQIIVIALQILGVMVATINHEKPQPAYNAYARLIAGCIYMAILYYGGFFAMK